MNRPVVARLPAAEMPVRRFRSLSLSCDGLLTGRPAAEKQAGGPELGFVEVRNVRFGILDQLALPKPASPASRATLRVGRQGPEDPIYIAPKRWPIVPDGRGRRPACFDVLCISA